MVSRSDSDLPPPGFTNSAVADSRDRAIFVPGDSIRPVAIRVLLGILVVALLSAQPAGYVDSKICGTCHAATSDSFSRTGMAQSFGTPKDIGSIADFYHPASDTHYSMSLRDGRHYQRRWQIGFQGKEENVEDLRVDYVLGSGNHAMTFVHRTARGRLLELPLSWYAEKGGYWGMSPGYDTAHPPSHRPITYECMACHNAYPAISSATTDDPVYTGELPHGIDCQRCHGPGAKHVRAATAGSSAAAIRASIVNPDKLSDDRKTEVCMQCHLETTSTRLPGILRKFDRQPFSFRPGQPLSDFVLYFDHAPGTGHDEKFEIVGSVYRLRQSRCFLQSEGKLTCTTCHDPHGVRGGRTATEHYTKVCLQCHAAAVERLMATAAHPTSTDCVTCHMPKRRSDDAVHIVMTDHRIQRQPPHRDLLAELPEPHPALAEEYRGAVVPYYPQTPNTLYTAIAQVTQRSNLKAGIADLSAAIGGLQHPQAEAWVVLGNAYRDDAQPARAVGGFERALRLHPNSAPELRSLGMALNEAGQPARAIQMLRRAAQLAPADDMTWLDLGEIALTQGHTNDAVADARRAVSLNPDSPDAENFLGAALAVAGDSKGAEQAYREALRVDPSYPRAHGNLARLLNTAGRPEEAEYHFAKAASLMSLDAAGLYEFAMTLVQLNRFDESQDRAEAAVRANPNFAEAHELLGGLLSRKHDLQGALRQYQAAVALRPDFSRARFDLGVTLAATDDRQNAIMHLRLAAKSSDSKIAQQAAGALRQLGVTP